MFFYLPFFWTFWWHFYKELAANTIDVIRKIADPKFVSWIGWRDSIVTFVRTHSKVTISMLTRIGAHPT